MHRSLIIPAKTNHCVPAGVVKEQLLGNFPPPKWKQSEMKKGEAGKSSNSPRSLFSGCDVLCRVVWLPQSQLSTVLGGQATEMVPEGWGREKWSQSVLGRGS